MRNNKQTELIGGLRAKQSAMARLTTEMKTMLDGLDAPDNAKVTKASARRSSGKKSPPGSTRGSICSDSSSVISTRKSVRSAYSSDDTGSIESVATTSSIKSDDHPYERTTPQGIRTIRRNGTDKSGQLQYAFALDSGTIVPFNNFQEFNKRLLARLTRTLNASLHDKREQSDINKEFCESHFVCLQKDARRHRLIDMGEAQLIQFQSGWR